MSYSKVLVNRFLVVLVLSTFIVLGLILISRSLQTEQFASFSYIPKEKVERVSILMREWITGKSSIDYKIKSSYSFYKSILMQSASKKYYLYFRNKNFKKTSINNGK